MSNLKKIKLDEFLETFEVMKKFHETGNDPLPEIKDLKELKSALDYPFQSVFGKVIYWGFYKKAACYFYGFAKGHILSNGNKRAGVLSISVFYQMNNRQCSLSDDEMYELSKFIANSNTNDKEKTIQHIAQVLKKHTIR